jgi:rod shape-determining protein MreD
MAASALVRFAAFARLCLPVAATVALILLSALPWGVPRLPSLEPILAIISVYYWAVYRPDLMPAGAAFLIGLVVDMLGGGPFGISALTLVLVQWIAIGQRRALIGKSFVIGWLGYLLISAGAVFVGWLFNSLFHARFLEPSPALATYVAGALVYPALALLLWRLQQIARPA